MSFTLTDLTATRTSSNGDITYVFDRTKAAKSLLAKMDMAIEIFDSRESKPEIWYYDAGYWHPGGEFVIQSILDDVTGNLSDSENISDVLRRIRGKLRLHPVEFDITHPYLVGCQGGITLDLQTGKTRKAVPTDLISMPIPVKYDPKAKCPNFIKFLEEVAATDDDRLSVIDFLASLLISQPMDFFVAAPGQGGNGRSKLKDFIRAFIGSDACRSIALKELNNRFTAGFLTRCRVNFCNETEIGGVALDFIKRCSEKMPVEQKFKGMVNALLYLKYFFDTNTMPVINDTSYGAERRLVRWDMPWRFTDNPNPEILTEKQRDPHIENKIITPEELSGVLNLILERAPVVIEQRIIHHRNGGLQEYALQSRSGDVFIDLFLEATNNEDNKVHVDTITKAYYEYCTLTNSNLLGAKALKTIIEDRFKRNIDRNIKINGLNRSGYRGLKFNSCLFESAIATIEKIRGESKSVFPTLIKMFPDIENSINSTKFYQILPDSTPKNTTSKLYGRIVEKYRGEKVEEIKENNGDEDSPRESSNHENSTILPLEATDRDSEVESGRIWVEKGRITPSDSEEKISPVVEEFLRDGGAASKERFLRMFPEARRPQDMGCRIIPACGGQKITMAKIVDWQQETWSDGNEREAAEAFLAWYRTAKAHPGILSPGVVQHEAVCV